MSNTTYTCPCCGYKSFEQCPPGTFEICSICYWEDDPVQFDDPFYAGGANTSSLYMAQRDFIKYGTSEELFVNAVRKPIATDQHDIHFKVTHLPHVEQMYFSFDGYNLSSLFRNKER